MLFFSMIDAGGGVSNVAQSPTIECAYQECCSDGRKSSAAQGTAAAVVGMHARRQAHARLGAAPRAAGGSGFVWGRAPSPAACLRQGQERQGKVCHNRQAANVGSKSARGKVSSRLPAGVQNRQQRMKTQPLHAGRAALTNKISTAASAAAAQSMCCLPCLLCEIAASPHAPTDASARVIRLVVPLSPNPNIMELRRGVQERVEEC